MHLLSSFPALEGLSWNGEAILLGLVLLLYYVFSLKNPSKYLGKKSVLFSIFLSLAILLTALVVDRGQVDRIEVVRLLGLVWVVPFVSTLIRLYGRQIVLLVAICVAVLHTQWASAQFILQHDLHLYLLGETRLSINGVGIAKFLTTSYKLIRAYGPYAHPNILSGVLSLSVIMWCQIKWRSRLAAFSLLAALLLGIVITFSRAAWLSAAISLALWYFTTWYPRPAIIRSFFWKIIGFTIMTLLLFSPLLLDRTTDYQDVAASERLSGLHLGISIWETHPWVGTGIGQYGSILTQYMKQRGLPYQPWEIVPIHVTPVLLLTEWGVLGIILLGVSLAMYSIYTHVNLVSYFSIKKSLWLLPTAPLLFLDHYLLTQTAPMVWYLVLLAALWLVAESLTDAQ